MHGERPWYEIGFDAEYPLMQVFEEEKTELQASSAEWLMNLPPRARILDLCCGYGRHSRAWRVGGGHFSVGLDLSADMLAIARAVDARHEADPDRPPPGWPKSRRWRPTIAFRSPIRYRKQ